MRVLLALIACALPAAAAATEFDPVEIPNGDNRLKAVVYKPAGEGPFPVVVGLHGCAGLNNSGGLVSSRYRDWGQRLAAAGFAVVFPDSYGSRGLSSQCSVRKPAVRTDHERVADVQATRAWVQQQSWAIGERLALVGWSTGGITALWAVRPRLVPKDGKPDFRSAVAFYPGCRRLANAAWSARVPTLILIGGADDQVTPRACQQMVAGTKGRSARVVLHVYPGAYHDFDHPNRRIQVRSGLAFSADGSGRVHTGTDPAARADALKRVPEWLKR